MYLLGGALIIVFAGALRSILPRAEGGDGWLAGMAFGPICPSERRSGGRGICLAEASLV